MKKFKKNIIDSYGNQGKDWLDALAALTAGLASKYQLTELQPVANMSFNYVATGLQHNNPIILKLGLNQKALAKEVACLKAFANQGAAEVIATEAGMILMQRASPGTTLKEYFPDQDNPATTIVCQCISNLHQTEIPEQHDFLHLKDLLSILDDDLDIPNNILCKARTRRDDLLQSTQKTVLLHGDLHHENLLKHGESWRVIDPQGFIGDPVFDVCAFIHNPMPELLQHTSPLKVIHNRIASCTHQLGYPKQRIQDWLYVKSVLCWAWCLEDNLAVDYFKQFIQLLFEEATP